VVYRQAYTRLFENLLSHVRVSKNSWIFQKNGPFITLERNVTAKLDKKYVDKMSQTSG
jgi:hypothetical protein